MSLSNSFQFPIPLQNYNPTGLAAKGINTQAMAGVDASALAFANPDQDVAIYAAVPSPYEAAIG